MAEYTGGAVTDLAVERIGPQTLEFSFRVPDDGLGEGAAVEVRGATVEMGEWWWGDVSDAPLVQLPHGSAPPGTVVTGIVADTGLDLDGRSMHFRAVAFRFDEAEGKNVFSEITPPNPGMRVDFDTWTEPEPQPEPDPVPQQEFTVVPPVAGDDGLTVELTWVEGVQAVTFLVNALLAFDTIAGDVGQEATKFLPLGSELPEGEQLTIQTIAHAAGFESSPWPEPPMELVVAAAPPEEPEPEPEPTPDPGFPATTTAEFPANTDEFYLDMPDGRRMKFGRLWKWLSFGWFGVFGVYIGREE